MKLFTATNEHIPSNLSDISSDIKCVRIWDELTDIVEDNRIMFAGELWKYVRDTHDSVLDYDSLPFFDKVRVEMISNGRLVLSDVTSDAWKEFTELKKAGSQNYDKLIELRDKCRFSIPLSLIPTRPIKVKVIPVKNNILEFPDGDTPTWEIWLDCEWLTSWVDVEKMVNTCFWNPKEIKEQLRKAWVENVTFLQL